MFLLHNRMKQDISFYLETIYTLVWIQYHIYNVQNNLQLVFGCSYKIQVRVRVWYLCLRSIIIINLYTKDIYLMIMYYLYCMHYKINMMIIIFISLVHHCMRIKAKSILQAFQSIIFNKILVNGIELHLHFFLYHK